MLLSELLSDFIFKEGSEAADQAKQLGLLYKGFGRWADPRTDKITHKTDGGRLVKVDPAQTKMALDDPEVEKDPGRATDQDPEAQARMKNKSPRVGAPSERETREKRFARRERIKTTVKDITAQIKYHDWHYDRDDDRHQLSHLPRQEDKIVDTIAKSGFTLDQTTQIFTNAMRDGMGTAFADEISKKIYLDAMKRRNQIDKDVQRGKKGAEPIPRPPTKWDAEKYDASFDVGGKAGGQGHVRRATLARDKKRSRTTSRRDKSADDPRMAKYDPRDDEKTRRSSDFVRGARRTADADDEKPRRSTDRRATKAARDARRGASGKKKDDKNSEVRLQMKKNLKRWAFLSDPDYSPADDDDYVSDKVSDKEEDDIRKHAEKYGYTKHLDGMAGSHWPRPNRSNAIDKLQWRKGHSPRVTKKGKMHKQDVGALKTTIKRDRGHSYRDEPKDPARLPGSSRKSDDDAERDSRVKSPRKGPRVGPRAKE